MKDLCLALIFAWALIRLTFKQCFPENFIHHVVPGEAIYDFFEAWKRATRECADARWGLRKWFIASAERLLLDGYDLLMQRKLLFARLSLVASRLRVWGKTTRQILRKQPSSRSSANY